jgi:CheY-like chemotaxis protein
MIQPQQPLHVLLADDDDDDRSLFKEALSEVKTPTSLITIEDGRKLMDYLARIKSPPPPDIIFLDINMPFKTGKECLREIRKDQKFENVPIIMFTTSSRRQDIDETFEHGANLYVPKSSFFDDDVNILSKLFSLNWDEYIPPARDSFVLIKS